MFSIILIIAFILVAVQAIKIFINADGGGISDSTAEATFKTDLQAKINEVWTSNGAIIPKFPFALPSKIEYVCFLDIKRGKAGSMQDKYENLLRYGGQASYNLYLYPGQKACKGFKAITLQHINITEITKQSNPYCVKNINGKGNLKIEMGFYDTLVKIS